MAKRNWKAALCFTAGALFLFVGAGLGVEHLVRNPATDQGSTTPMTVILFLGALYTLLGTIAQRRGAAAQPAQTQDATTSMRSD